MNIYFKNLAVLGLFCCAFMFTAAAGAQNSPGSHAVADSPAASATHVPTAHLIQPEDLAALLRSSKPKPLVLQVGFRVLYAQAHIPASEYVAAGSSPGGVRRIRDRVEKLPRNKAIVLYCGCCPWIHCPNVQPAYQELQSMGFTNVKVLYIAQDFGADWVSKGYPVETGQ